MSTSIIDQSACDPKPSNLAPAVIGAPPLPMDVSAPVMAAPAEQALVPGKPDHSLLSGFAVGKVELRTAAEDQELVECEAIIRASWAHFARLGDALRRIRDKELFKNEYGSFEDYCRQRWGFGRSQASRYISAAEVHRTIAAVAGMPLPNCEAQVRPLVGLPDEVVICAWGKALSWSKDGHVPGLWVERAVRQELRVQPAAARPQGAGPDRLQRFRLRQSVRTGFSELLALLLADTRREVLIAKVQEIDRLLDPILSPKKKQLVSKRLAS